jgi:hypothetical protein
MTLDQTIQAIKRPPVNQLAEVGRTVRVLAVCGTILLGILIVGGVVVQVTRLCTSKGAEK